MAGWERGEKIVWPELAGGDEGAGNGGAVPPRTK
jgi:hypothetical protein